MNNNLKIKDKALFILFVLVVLFFGTAFVSAQTIDIDELLRQAQEASQGSVGTYEVSLIQDEPVFTKYDIPSGFDGPNSRAGYFPFPSINSLPDGRFVLGGYCASGAGEPRRVIFESGGMYLLDQNGNYIATQDVCRDTAVKAQACFEGGGCSASSRIFPVDDDTFIRELGTYFHGIDRAPAVYDVESSAFDLVERLFFNDWFFSVGTNFPTGDIVSYQQAIVANGIMAGVERRYEGYKRIYAPGYSGSGQLRQQYSNQLVFYTVPQMRYIAETSVPAPSCSSISSSGSCSGVPLLNESPYYPVVGVGDYFLATDGRQSLHDFSIYRMPSRTDLEDGEFPEKIGEIEKDVWLKDYTYDAQDRNRLALLWYDNSVDIYEAGEDGLELVESYPNLPNRDIGGKTSVFEGWTQFGLSGNHLVGARCTVGSLEGVGGEHHDCSLVVLEDGVELAVEPLPISGPDSLVDIRSTGVSPNGLVLISVSEITTVTEEDPEPSGAWGDVYAYQIGLTSQGSGVPTTGTGNIPTTGIGNLTPQQPTIEYFLDIANQFMQSFQNIFGTPSSGTQSTGPCANPPSTVQEIREFQCRYDIVCSGDIESTGYGNFGPLTRAKWQEVCSQIGTQQGNTSSGGPSYVPGDVRGANIDLSGYLNDIKALNSFGQSFISQ